MTKIIIRKKKVRGHGGHHGGAWKVAYADFVTAMMAFFLVMWILGLSEDTRKAISGYFTEPGLFSFTTGKALPIEVVPSQSRYRSTTEGPDGAAAGQLVPNRQKLASAGEQIQETLKKLGANDDAMRRLLESVSVTITGEGLRIELVEGERSGFFDVGGAKPNDPAIRILSALAPQLAKLGQPIRIEGHTDSRKFVSRKGTYGNWELSTDRANAARRILLTNGVKDDQIDSVVGYAANQLRNPQDPLSISNRRVSILVRETPAPKGDKNENAVPPVISIGDLDGALKGAAPRAGSPGPETPPG